MFKKIITASLVAATLAGASLAATGTAEAHWHSGGFGAGLVGGLVGGALLGAAVEPHYYAGPAYYYGGPRCFVRTRRIWDTPHAYHYANVTVCR